MIPILHGGFKKDKEQEKWCRDRLGDSLAHLPLWQPS